MEGTGNKGYISGDGQYVEYPAAERGAPVEWSGETVDGDQFALTELRGQPAVVVVWASWCPPCRAEAPDLVEVAKEYDGRVGFTGINLRESRDNAAAFQRTSGMDWPSFFSPDSAAMLAFDGVLGLNTIPATVVLDAEGRVASAILGPLPSPSVLSTLLDDVLDETPGAEQSSGPGDG